MSPQSETATTIPFSDITDKRTNIFVENEGTYYKCLDKRLSYIKTEKDAEDFFVLF